MSGTGAVGRLEVRQDELVYQHPPFPFVDWSEAAVRKYLVSRGFDLEKKITRIDDLEGSRWIQEVEYVPPTSKRVNA